MPSFFLLFDQELSTYISCLWTKYDIDFWITKDPFRYPLLTLILQDLVSAPASQA
jgi:hypothetical protein